MAAFRSLIFLHSLPLSLNLYYYTILQYVCKFTAEVHLLCSVDTNPAIQYHVSNPHVGKKDSAEDWRSTNGTAL